MESLASNPLTPLLEVPDTEVPDLGRAALTIAQDEYPALDVAAYLSRLDAYADEIRMRLPYGADYEAKIATMNQYLFEELGFTGNATDFYDPRNSYLNDVLDRKLGIPITISVVYMEIGRRIGLPLIGVSFPGHFLVKLPLDGAAVVLDPFNGGIALDESDLRRRLVQTYGDGAAAARAPVTALLASATATDVVLRMLRNLKGVYLQRGDHVRALRIMHRILELATDVPEELRDRGNIYRELECFRAALNDYNAYLHRNPQATDAIGVREHIVELQKIATHLH